MKFALFAALVGLAVAAAPATVADPDDPDHPDCDSPCLILEPDGFLDPDADPDGPKTLIACVLDQCI